MALVALDDDDRPRRRAAAAQRGNGIGNRRLARRDAAAAECGGVPKSLVGGGARLVTSAGTAAASAALGLPARRAKIARSSPGGAAIWTASSEPAGTYVSNLERCWRHRVRPSIVERHADEEEVLRQVGRERSKRRGLSHRAIIELGGGPRRCRRLERLP